MLFNTVDFFVFLALVLAGFYLLPIAARKYWLLAASYYFYGSWNARFLGLLLGVTVMDWLAGLWIERTPIRLRRLVLVISLSANLCVLAYFKYFHFLTESLLRRHFDLEIVLPIGISFHIFQSMSYVVDVYRNQQVPVRNFFDYALFLAFFPQLVAGPIVRANQFFQDLFPWRPPTAEDLSRGVLLLALGLTKKMAFADNFAKVSDTLFNSLPTHDGILDAWSGTIAFSLQIFFDFSGYTDMAIGMAKLFGFHFPINFRRPYLAASITDFWRRWHISLSTWLRDYLYISLGGNRKGSLATYRNLLLTMLLGGLWHGASWNFVLWGGWHGLLLAIERAAGLGEAKGFWRWCRTPITFLLVLHGWVLFRAPSFAEAQTVMIQLWRAPLGHWLFTNWHMGLGALAILLALAEEAWDLEGRLIRGPLWLYSLVLAGMFVVLVCFAVVDQAIPFIYFQF